MENTGAGYPVAAGYLDHLTASDVRLLAALSGLPGDELVRRPDVLLRTISSSDTAARLLPRQGTAGDALMLASPFLVFAVALHRVTAEVASSRYLPEWTGPRQRLPVFVGEELTRYAADDRHRLFLAELLASYAQVMSGSYLERTRVGWRRRRWSELDPVALAGLLVTVPAEQRSGIFRRLGDLALFLTGVFPDHTALHGFGPVRTAQLLRSVGAPGQAADAAPVTMLEQLGVRWYRLAADSAIATTAQTRLVREVADRFAAARRVLNLLADRYLMPARNPWFSDPRTG